LGKGFLGYYQSYILQAKALTKRPAAICSAQPKITTFIRMRRRPFYFLLLGIAIGMGVGVAINSIAIGAGVGVALGMAMSGIYANRRK